MGELFLKADEAHHQPVVLSRFLCAHRPRDKAFQVAAARGALQAGFYSPATAERPLPGPDQVTACLLHMYVVFAGGMGAQSFIADINVWRCHASAISDPPDIARQSNLLRDLIHSLYCQVRSPVAGEHLSLRIHTAV